MTLKIRPQDLERLKQAIVPLDTEKRRTAYRAGNFRNAENTQDKDKRYRWDLLYGSGLKIGDGVGTQGDLNLYGYLDDTHIDSALCAIVPPLAGQAPA